MSDNVTIAAEPSAEEMRSLIKDALARDGLLELAEIVGMAQLTFRDRMVILAYDLADVADKLRALDWAFGDTLAEMNSFETLLEAIDHFRIAALAKSGDTP